VKALGAEVGVRFLTLGCDPTTHMAATPVMPDKRYQLLRGILADAGSRALDTMFNSCTTQVFQPARVAVRRSLCSQPGSSAPELHDTVCLT
jgi:gamma-glutamylcysteine synthetase